MKGRKTVPLPPLQMDKLQGKFKDSAAVPKLSEPPSSISSVLQTSHEDYTEPKDSSARPKTLLSLLTRSRRPQSSVSSQLFSDLSTPEESKSETNGQLITAELQAELKEEAEAVLKPLSESAELKSDGEFTHQSDISNVFHAERDKKQKVKIPTPMETSSNSDTPKDESEQVAEDQQPSERISSEADEQLHSFGTPIDSSKDPTSPDPRSHVKVLSRQGTFFKKRQGSSSTLGSPESAVVMETREAAVSRMKTMKSIRSHVSQPLSESSEKREERYRREFEEYVEERGDNVSLPVKELFESYLQEPAFLVSELDLSNSSLSDGDIMDICQLAQALRSLEVINLANNEFAFRLEEDRADFYRRNQTRVRVMWLSGNPLGEGQLSKALIQFLLCHVNMEILHLSNCGLTDLDLRVLATNLVYLRELKVLDIRNNEITDSGAFIVVQLLKNSEDLQKVMLERNRLTHKAKERFKGFEHRVEFDVQTKCCCEIT